MYSVVTEIGETDRIQVSELTSCKGSLSYPDEGQRNGGYSSVKSPSTDRHHDRPGTPLERVACTGIQVKCPKVLETDSDLYSKLTMGSLEVGGGSSGSGLRLPSTRVTVYPQRDISSSWKGRRDFSLPKLDVLKVQLETQWADEEHGNDSRSLSVPGSIWASRAWSLGRTRSADSYFRSGLRHSDQASTFHSRVQMERAFNAYGKSQSKPSVPPCRKITSIPTYSRQQASASSNPQKVIDSAAATPAWYSAPNRQRVVRKSPPWRSLMNRRPQGVRSDNNKLCPFHCRCCFNEVNDIEGSTVYKMDLGTL